MNVVPSFVLEPGIRAKSSRTMTRISHVWRYVNLLVKKLA